MSHCIVCTTPGSLANGSMCRGNRNNLPTTPTCVGFSQDVETVSLRTCSHTPEWLAGVVLAVDVVRTLACRICFIGNLKLDPDQLKVVVFASAFYELKLSLHHLSCPLHPWWFRDSGILLVIHDRLDLLVRLGKFAFPICWLLLPQHLPQPAMVTYKSLNYDCQQARQRCQPPINLNCPIPPPGWHSQLFILCPVSPAHSKATCP